MRRMQSLGGIGCGGRLLDRPAGRRSLALASAWTRLVAGTRWPVVAAASRQQHYATQPTKGSGGPCIANLRLRLDRGNKKQLALVFG